jgi:putative holliday junction resolvase
VSAGNIHKALGVDLGARRIGLAVSAGALAVAHDTLERSGDADADRAAIVDAARCAGCDTIVVGIPRSLSGEDGPAALAARAEIDAIRSVASDLEVVGHDERFTTVIADRELRHSDPSSEKRRARIDETAAAVMLQSFLDHSP